MYFQQQNKFSESNQKTARARNDYILALVSANAAIRKFFVDDQPELINVCRAIILITIILLLVLTTSSSTTVNTATTTVIIRVRTIV